MSQIRRDPSNEVVAHLIRGGDQTRMPIKDTEEKERAGLDSFAEHDSPLTYTTPGSGNFESQTADAIQAANLQQAAALSSDSVLGRPIDMAEMNLDTAKQDNTPFGPEPAAGGDRATDGR